MTTNEKASNNPFIPTGGKECHYCGTTRYDPREDKHCIRCGVENPDYDIATQGPGFGSDCDDHSTLKASMQAKGHLCVVTPFCEDCGYCAVPVTWREHKNSSEPGRISFELIKDNKQVGFVYFRFTPNPDNPAERKLDPRRMTISRKDLTLKFKEFYEHIENAPNLPDDIRHLLMVSKDSWDVGSDDTTMIHLKH